MSHYLTDADREAAIQAMNAIERQRSFGGNGTALRQVCEIVEAHRIASTESLTARVAELEGALVAEREENLWNAYHTGHVKGGRWTHMFMSDGEALAQSCGFDPRAADYDDAAIRAAIPIIARQALGAKHD